MNNVLIVSSKKYLKSKHYNELISLLNKNKIKYLNYYVESFNFKYSNLKDTNLIISVGGDGTALKSMKLGWSKNIPVLSIGSGRIGYLVNNLKELDFNLFFDKKITYNLKKPIIQNGDVSTPAFNEVVIIKNSPTRLLDLEINTYNQKVNLRADGIIISTALGSTAYNYSAGGPIVQSSLESLIVTPISPFTKFPRSIVLDPKSEIKVVIKKGQNYSIQFDGFEVFKTIENIDKEYNYKLSNKKLKLLNSSDEPKLNHFLNQILR